MTRLTFIAGTYDPRHDGVSDYTRRLRSLLADEGVDSTVLTTDAAAGAGEEPDLIGAVDGWGPSALPDLVRTVRRLDPPILHVQHAAGTYGFRRSIFLLPPLLRAAGWRGRLVTTLHEYGWWEWDGLPAPVRPVVEAVTGWGQRRGWWDAEDLFLTTGSDAIVVTNGAADDVLRQRLPELSATVTQIPIAANVPAVDVSRERARQQLRAETGWCGDTTVVAFFGFLHPVKGIDALLEAFAELRLRRPEARLLLVGGVTSLALPGEEATRYDEELTGRIAALGLQPYVHRTGYRGDEEVSMLLHAADLGALPFHQGLTTKSGALLTLLQHGVPVVGTRAPRSDPLLEDQPGLVLVAPRDRAAIAAALEHWIADSASRGHAVAAARSFSRRFEWKEIAYRHLELYGELGLGSPLDDGCRSGPDPVDDRRR